MRSTIKFLLLGTLVVGICVGAYSTYSIWTGQTAAKSGKPFASAPVVKTAFAQKKSLPVQVRANGYASALNSVDIKSLTQGRVRSIYVKEGQDVKAGQLLFLLDDRADVANVEKSRAQVLRDRADLADAEATLRRSQELLGKGYVAQSVVDGARAKVDALYGTLNVDLASVRAMEVNLGYNRITAGISGRLGAISVRPGSVVQPSGAVLATIVQIDPIAVAFSVTEKDLAPIAANYAKSGVSVVAQLPVGKEVEGKLMFIDNGVDSQTGGVRMKAQFANGDHALWPGAFVNVRVLSHTLVDAIVVPAQAVVSGPTEQFVYVVQSDNTVRVQKVSISAIEDGLAAVTGLRAGEKVVVEGGQNLRPGYKVREPQKTSEGTRSTAGDGVKWDASRKKPLSP